MAQDNFFIDLKRRFGIEEDKPEITLEDENPSYITKAIKSVSSSFSSDTKTAIAKLKMQKLDLQKEIVAIDNEIARLTEESKNNKEQ